MDADLVVTIGGASVGDHDLMKPALANFEPQLVVDKIAVRPGKPTWFARTIHGPVLGLPGNPASALVCAHLFLKPIIQSMLGQNVSQSDEFLRARLAEPLPSNGPREHYVRAWLDADTEASLVVKAAEQQDSALLSVFSRSNCLIRLQPNCPALNIGDAVDVLRLNR